MRFLTITLLIIALSLTTSCTKQQKEIEIYSFSGENDAVMINNGVIIATEDLEKFIGGDLTFKGEEPSNVKYYVTKFYYYKDGVETAILSNSESIEGTTKGTKISPDLGSSNSEDLFYANDLVQINKSLNFSVSGFYMNGEKFEYSVVLDVEKAY
ncbi:hypothetical protein [Desulfosporosinus shakirovi]|uniref:hypothetical protein n=1 Tax=Desulfosporosinus shakirovi TaxID=2885154 RepID=UPI001E2B94A8|nr:hypothetical protein [Desulfosporosinus sp. SRJS8]MCB8818563.1 hypothetical protein [Desulfosporosinus sp. SRJS8]